MKGVEKLMGVLPQRREGRIFFLEKKKQKTLDYWSAGWRRGYCFAMPLKGLIDDRGRKATQANYGLLRSSCAAAKSLALRGAGPHPPSPGGLGPSLSREEAGEG
jgi:hypothetical protein